MKIIVLLFSFNFSKKCHKLRWDQSKISSSYLVLPEASSSAIDCSVVSIDHSTTVVLKKEDYTIAILGSNQNFTYQLENVSRDSATLRFMYHNL